ncbi:MAG: hypothetical protein M3522_03780, partial [Actinomycetota bacterium]|nr:hypothetical protein [Actinomycetota bacterium]
ATRRPHREVGREGVLNMAKGKSGGGKSGGKSGGSKSSGSKTRSAISGRYVTTAHGNRSPRTTVRESD